MHIGKVIFIYCVCDDVCKHLGIKDNEQCKMSSAEVIMVAITAAMFFGGNISRARLYFQSHGLVTTMLSHSRLNRKILEFEEDIWKLIFSIVASSFKHAKQVRSYAVDSFPVPACHSCRSWRCKLFTGKEYLGFSPSKKLRYYGLKAHIIVSSESGDPVEFFLTPASHSDIKSFSKAERNLPSGSVVYGDKAYTSYSLEDSMREVEQLYLFPHRRRNLKRQHSGPQNFILMTARKRVETAISQITRMMPRSINARSAKGFTVRVFLFTLAYAFSQLAKQ